MEYDAQSDLVWERQTLLGGLRRDVSWGVNRLRKLALQQPSPAADVNNSGVINANAAMYNQSSHSLLASSSSLFSPTKAAKTADTRASGSPVDYYSKPTKEDRGKKRRLSSAPSSALMGNEKLTLWVKIAYSLPLFTTSAMILPTHIHINKYYADTLLVKPGWLAMATALARSFDTLLDPFFGWLSDNTRTRWGRRKPYIFFSAPLCAFFYYLLFNPSSDFTPFEAAVWFGIFFSLYLTVPLSLTHHWYVSVSLVIIIP